MTLDVKAQRRVLERQRDELKAKLRDVDSSWNALAPLNCLPIETLSYIFTLHSASLTDVVGASQNRYSSLERIRIGHVCRHWREVALGSSALWSNIIFTTPEAAASTLSRSTTAPLTVALLQGDSPPCLLEFLSHIISNHRHRLRSLEATDISLGVYGILPSLAAPMPVLEKLALRLSMFGDYIFDPPAEIQRPDLPERFLDGTPPVLKHLEIVDLGIPQYNILPLVPTLVYLHLGSKQFMATKPPAAAFVQTLQELPLLETLVLHEYVPLGPYPLAATETPVKCASLRMVSLRDSLRSIQDLLDVIQIPQASIEVAFTEIVSDTESHAQFSQSFAKSRCIGGRVVLQELTIKSLEFEPEAVVFDFVFHRKPGGNEITKADPGLSVAFLDPLPLNAVALVPSLAKFVDQGPLHSLRVELARGFSAIVWEVFGVLPNIRNIVFDGQADALGFCSLLNVNMRLPDHGRMGPGTGSIPWFPSLCNLTLDWSSFRRDKRARHLIADALNGRPEAHRLKALRVFHYDAPYSRPGSAAHAFAMSLPTLNVEWVRRSHNGWGVPDDGWGIPEEDDSGSSGEEMYY